MSKENLWDITNRVQTQLKLDILGKYLKAWADIIGSNFSEGYYIDCFAGRGKYHKDGVSDCILGSPLIAQNIGLKVQEQKQKKGKNFKFKIMAIDSDKENLEELGKFFKENDPQNRISVRPLYGEFQSLVPDVIKDIGSYPAFFFIDPYGIKSIPKNALDYVIDRASNQEKTEILLNYMSMGVKRVAGLKGIANHQNDIIRLKAVKSMKSLDNLVGDSSWMDKEGKEILTYFADRVLRRGFKVILNFDVPYPDRSGTFYNLIFATNNLVAKKIMSSVLTKKLFEGTLFENMPFEVDHGL